MNGLANITVGGQTVRLKFGLPAVRRIFEKMKTHEFIETRHGKEQYNDLAIAHILYAGYLNGCMLVDEVPLLAFEPFYELVEDYAADQKNSSEIIDAVRAFEESRFVKAVTGPVKDEGKEGHMEKKSH